MIDVHVSSSLRLLWWQMHMNDFTHVEKWIRTVPSLAFKVNGSDVHEHKANQCYGGHLNTWGSNMVRGGSVEMHGGVCECISTYMPIYRSLWSIYRWWEWDEVTQEQVETVVVGDLHGYIGSTRESDFFKTQSFIPDKEKYMELWAQHFERRLVYVGKVHALLLTVQCLPQTCTENKKCQIGAILNNFKMWLLSSISMSGTTTNCCTAQLISC